VTRDRTPVIGAVNGPAFTGGLEIALGCDFLIASERAIFGDTHAHVGILPGGGMTARLPQLVGAAMARRMSMTGEIVDTRRAAQIDDNGEVIGTHGFYIDVTPTSTRKSEEAITAKVAAIAERRGVIDQAKGMLMLIYGVDEDAAFNVLKSLSRGRNMKLWPLARQIAEDFAELGKEAITSHARFDQRLLSAHLRAANRPE
jgi:enoyl-CoA hydratase/carnithine racemase